MLVAQHRDTYSRRGNYVRKNGVVRRNTQLYQAENGWRAAQLVNAVAWGSDVKAEEAEPSGFSKRFAHLANANICIVRTNSKTYIPNKKMTGLILSRC